MPPGIPVASTHGAILRDKFNKATTRQDFVDILTEYFG
jgi:hypothetical protein